MKVFIGPYVPWDEEGNREINVEIHDYDTWNMDSTLALVILPMLKQLKETKQGAPGSMPAFSQVSHYYSQETMAFYEEDNDVAWDEGHKQWEEILDKMIWSFEQLLEDWEDQYHSGEYDVLWEDVEGTDCKLMVHGPKHTHTFDFKGYSKHLERIKEGFRLFGQYYMDLWD